MKIKIGILVILFVGLISMNPAAAAENEVYIIKVAETEIALEKDTAKEIYLRRVTGSSSPIQKVLKKF